MGAGNANTDELKEIKFPGPPRPLTLQQDKVIFRQQIKSLCQITASDCKATGFLCRIPNILNPVLITCNHVLNETEIKPGKEISIYFTDENDDRHYKTIKIDETRTTYTVGKLDDEEIDTTIIELRPEKDNLNEQEFMEIDIELMSDNVKDIYECKDIYLIGYRGGEEIRKSTGVIVKIKKKDKSYTLFHLCDMIVGFQVDLLFYLIIK